MSFKELLDAYEKVEGRVNAYWTYWSVVVVAVAGWLFGAEAIEPIQRQAILAALVVFFAANLCVLLPATRLAAGFREELRLGAAEAGLRSEALARALGSNRHELRVPLTAGLHLSVDAAVIGVVLLEASTP